MLEYKCILKFPKNVVEELIKSTKQDIKTMEGLTSFNSLPTAMLFKPEEPFEGSLHFMYFPADASQLIHWHPSDRYLILLGDVEVYIAHSTSEISENPNDNLKKTVIPAYNLSCVRFPGQYWHSFSTSDQQGLGVIAFSFHNADYLNDDGIPENLMEELTVYWSDNG